MTYTYILYHDISHKSFCAENLTRILFHYEKFGIKIWRRKTPMSQKSTKQFNQRGCKQKEAIERPETIRKTNIKEEKPQIAIYMTNANKINQLQRRMFTKRQKQTDTKF